MYEAIQQSATTAAYRRVYFALVDATDGITPETGVTGAARLSKNGAATAASSNSIVEIDATNMPGRYYLELTASECDTLGVLILRFKAAATAEMIAQVSIAAFDPFAAGATTAETAEAVAAALATAEPWNELGAAGTRTNRTVTVYEEDGTTPIGTRVFSFLADGRLVAVGALTPA